MTRLGFRQKIQEREYDLPYHYSDLFCEEQRLIWRIEARSRLSLIKKLLAPFRGQRILDAGCGDGRVCYELSSVNAKVVGLDSSGQALNYARAFNPRIKFIQASLDDLPSIGIFDQILLFETLEHIPPKKIPVILAQLNRVLAKRGRLFVAVPSTRLPLRLKHYQHFSPELLRRTLAPYFRVAKIFGYHEVSYRTKIFYLSVGLGYLFYPLRGRLSLIRRYFEALYSYFDRHLMVCSPEAGSGLVAICQKRQTGR